MKKIAIVICSVIYFMAIVIVAFLGFKAEVQNPPFYTEDIVLAYECPHEEYDNGTVIFSVTENENYREELLDETSEVVYKYTVHIEDFEFIYYALDGEIKIPAIPTTFRYDDEGNNIKPTVMDLSYNVASDIITCSGDGTIKFTEYLSHGVYTMMIKSKDGSNKSIFVRIYW